MKWLRRLMACLTCRAEINRWLDSSPTTVLPRLGLGGAGAAYDTTPAGVVGIRRARYEQWRTLVREQTALIRAYCAANHPAGTVFGGKS